MTPEAATIPDTAQTVSARDRSFATLWLPPVIAALLVLLITWWGYSDVLSKTRGEFAYALDDAYIHLALAKNIVQHGVWGVTPYETTAAGSSPLWALLLVIGFLITGVNDWLPMLLNLVAGVALVFAADRILRKADVSVKWRAVLLGLLVLGIPYLALAFTGMEHLLHIFLLLLLADALLDAFQAPMASKRQVAKLFLLGLLATLTRYESMFLLVAPAFYAYRDRRLELAAPFVGGAAAILAFGLYSIAVGMPFIPTTMQLKGIQGMAREQGTPLVLTAGQRAWRNFSGGFVSPITISTIGALVAIWGAWKRKAWMKPFFVTLLTAFAMHFTLSSTLQLFRYDAYLYALTLIAVGAALRSIPGQKSEGYAELALGFFALTLMSRLYTAVLYTTLSCKNIHDQQIQMAGLMREHFSGGTIALNDIGAVSYYSGVHVVDLYGLASKSVGTLKLTGAFDTKAMWEILQKRNPDVIVVYPEWFQRYGGLPRQLVPIASWRIPDNFICAFPRVMFYAMPGGESRLRRALRSYEQKLPPGVLVEYASVRARS